MDNVIAFRPRPRPAEPIALPTKRGSLQPTPSGAALRASLEEAAQTALDAADQIIAALDRIDDDADDEEADPAFTAMAAHAGQVFRFREPQPKPEPVPEPVPELTPVAAYLPEPEAVAASEEEASEPKPVFEPIRLPWRETGNVVAAAGCAVLTLVAEDHRCRRLLTLASPRQLLNDHPCQAWH